MSLNKKRFPKQRQPDDDYNSNVLYCNWQGKMLMRLWEIKLYGKSEIEWQPPKTYN